MIAMGRCLMCNQELSPLQCLGLGLFGVGHRCPPLELTSADRAPELEPTPFSPPQGGPLDAVDDPQPPPLTLATIAQQLRFGAPALGQPPGNAAPLSLASFLPTTPRQLMRMQRECALLNGGGSIDANTACGHGSFGYALCYLEWEGLAARTSYDTGPAVADFLYTFTLTPKGEAVRAALLAPIERRGDRHAI